MKGRKEDGDRITFIYSLYHGHSIKRSVSSRDDRSSRSQHPHVVSQSFAICGNCRGGLRITEGIESQRLKDPYNLARPSIHLYLHFPRFVSFCPSFFSPRSTFLPSFPSFSLFSPSRPFSIQISMFIVPLLILTSTRWDFSFTWNCFEGKLREFLHFRFANIEIKCTTSRYW